MIKALEAHNGLSALIVEKSAYDAIWVSSLTHAASKGLPDNELVSLKERIDLVKEMRAVAKKPIIVDVDTFGQLEHIPYYTREFCKAGATLLVMEDKQYPKQNSLLDDGKHTLEDVDRFCQKIMAAKANVTNGVKIAARLESLIAKKSMFDALIRARAYVGAGADMILVHSKQQIDATEVMEFAKEFAAICNAPMIAVPTTYQLPEEHPFTIVIHANHLLRASMHAMMDYAKNGKYGVSQLSSVTDIFDLVGH